MLAVFVTLACSGDDGPQDSVDVTPVGTKDATPTPDTADPSAGAPAPVEPELDEELTEVTRGTLEATIAPGTSYAIEPESIAADAGTLDACDDNFQFDFSWQISEPYPPDDTALAWVRQGESGAFDVAAGPAGNQAVGCGTLTAENRGPSSIVVAVKYAIGVLP
jgi:hypothetical protein